MAAFAAMMAAGRNGMSESEASDIPPPLAPMAETGTGSGETASPAPVIPWQRRKEIGRLRAYWWTVFYVLRRNGRLGRHLEGPVSYRDAQRFRWLTVAHAVAFSLAYVLIFLAAQVPEFLRAAMSGEPTNCILPLVGAGYVLVTQFLVYALTTGVVSWLFCPRKRDVATQNRSIALSCYTAAPLALLLLAAVPLLLVPALLDTTGADQAPGDAFRFFLDDPEGVGPLFGSGGGDGTNEDGALLKWGPLIAWLAIFAIHLYWFQLVLFAVRSVAGRSRIGIIVAAGVLLAAWVAIDLLFTDLLPAAILMGLLLPASLA